MSEHEFKYTPSEAEPTSSSSHLTANEKRGIKKIGPTDEQWDEQIQYHRELQEGKEMSSVNEIYGHKFLSALKDVREGGKRLKKLQSLKAPKFTIEDEIQLQHKKLKDSIVSYNINLKLESEILQNLLHQFLESGQSAGTFISGLNLTEEEQKRYLLAMQQDAKNTGPREDNFTRESAKTLADIIKNRPDDELTLSQNALESLLTVYKNDFYNKEREIKSYIQERLPKIIDIILSEIKKYGISLDESLMQQKLQTLKVEILDPISAKRDGKLGDYFVKNHTIRVISTQDIAELEHVLTHELFHAVSGLLATAYNESEYATRETGAEEIKLGLSFGTGSYDGRSIYKRPNFTWLNEAVTESLTNS